MPRLKLLPPGDKACLERDYAGAKVYYTLAITKYGELSDEAGEQAAQEKLDSVEQLIADRRDRKRWRRHTKAREKAFGSRVIYGG